MLKTTSCQHAEAAVTLLELTGDMLQLSAVVVCINSLLYLPYSDQNAALFVNATSVHRLSFLPVKEISLKACKLIMYYEGSNL